MANIAFGAEAGHGDLGELAAAIGNMGQFVSSLQERVRLLEAVIENFPGGISLFDKNLQMVLCNRQQKELLEYSDELFAGGYPSLERLFRFNAERGEYGPGDVELHVKRRMALARKREPHVYERRRPNGTIVEVRGVPLNGGGFLTTYFDVTEQRRTRDLIAHMAHHDPLTDLPNRILFNDRLQNAVALAKRGALMAVHYIDIDRFKPVNDRYGHKAGDDLLVGIAGRMRAMVREHDTVARLGGDEFAVVQTGIRVPRDAETLARRIVEKLAAPFRFSPEPISIGASVGVALAPLHGDSSDELLMKADAALYAAKADGRSRFTIYDA